jgi:hypothetical protein
LPNLLRRAPIYVAFNVPLGRANPYLLGLAIGRWPRKRSLEEHRQWLIDQPEQ